MIRERAGTLEAVLGVNEASGFVHLSPHNCLSSPIIE